MLTSPWIYFSDPVLRAPTIGCMLMCFSAALVGVMAYLRKQSLVGESLSHASFPGVILGVSAAGGLLAADMVGIWIATLTMVGAFLSALLGLWIIHLLERKGGIHADAALCLVLSIFFGVGLTLASHIQFLFPTLYKQALGYLYGQAATMTDTHIWLYGLFSVITLLLICLFYKEMQISSFDRDYASSLGVPVPLIDSVLFVLIALAVVVGIRSVGVVLMSSMLIGPPVAARQYTHRLWLMLLLAGVFGLVSGFLGNYLSVEISLYLETLYPQSRLSLPTGPMIVLAATMICVLSLLLAPERGLVIRGLRIAYFRYRCLCENLLKSLWRVDPKKTFSRQEVLRLQNLSPWYLKLILWRLKHNGWIETSKGGLRLTVDGAHRAAHIVRLHRLWEVYLADYLGIGAERVHRSAEEMEHIITPEIEKELTRLLKDPKRDPHQQPIPPRNDHGI